MEEVRQVAASFDTAGGMAKCVMDLALLSDVLLQQTDPGRASLVSAIQDGWEGVAVGSVDIELWHLSPKVRGHVPGYDDRSVSHLIRFTLTS
jgi:amidase